MHAVDKSPILPSFDDVLELARDDMKSVDELIKTSLESDVAKGENAGRVLRHAGVVRALVEVGETKKGGQHWSGSATVPFGDDWDRANLRAVAFLQEKGSRAVVAIGVQSLTE